MSFGCRSSVDQWLRISKALSFALNRWGVHNLTYIDDFIFIAASKHECEEAVRKFKALCADWDVVLKEEKDAAPAQKMTALGIEYDLIKFTRRITEKRRLEIQANLKLATKSRDRRLWENLVGVLWFVSPCIPIALPYIYTLNQAVGRARHAKRGIEFANSVQSALDWHGSAIIMRLDCLALVAAMNKGRHQHEPINDIMSELNHLQMKHDFVLTPSWVRRFKNEAADALSKDDMPRFWHNIQGDRTLIELTPDHLRLPTNAHGPRRARLTPTKIKPKPTAGERRGATKIRHTTRGQ
jgi:hypothetical protein